MSLITRSSLKATKISIIDECANIRDDTMTCESMKQCDANDIVMYFNSNVVELSATACLYF